MLDQKTTNPTPGRGVWQEDEHQRFLEALKRHPKGPWAAIARVVGTRSARQVQTHAQKYYEKIERHLRGLQRDRSRGGSTGTRGRHATAREHEIDVEILEACGRALENGERLPTPARPRSGAAQKGKAESDPQVVGTGSDEDDSDLILPLENSIDFLMELLSGIDDASDELALNVAEERYSDY